MPTGVATSDRHVTMEDLLKYLRVRHESFVLGNATLEKALSIDFVRMRGSDEVHRDIGVDQDHFGSATS